MGDDPIEIIIYCYFASIFHRRFIAPFDEIEFYDKQQIKGLNNIYIKFRYRFPAATASSGSGTSSTPT